MRVLFVSPSGGAGMGVPTQIEYPCEAARLGVKVAVLGRGSSPKFSGLVESIELGAGWRSLRRRVDAIRGAIERLRPDIVHVFWHLDAEVYPLVIRSRPRPLWIVDARTPVVAKGRLGILGRLSGRLAPLCYDRIAAHALAVGQELFGRRTLQVLPPGYEPALFHPNPSDDTPSHDSELRVVYSGSLRAWRNLGPAFARLVEMVGSVPAGLPRRPVVDIYGLGDDEGTLRAIADRTPDIMRVHGYLPQAQLAERLRSCDVGLSLLPNAAFSKAPPLKTIEFLATGLPVLASDTPGNRAYVEDGVNGWLVDETLDRVPELLLRMCREGVPREMRERAVRSVDGLAWAKIVERELLPFYRASISERTQCAPA